MSAHTDNERSEAAVDVPRLVRVPLNPEFEDILPCPCCSDEKATRRARKPEWIGAFDPKAIEENGTWEVVCPCGLRMGRFATEKSAIENWNRRGGKFLNNDGELRFTDASVNEQTADEIGLSASPCSALRILGWPPETGEDVFSSEVQVTSSYLNRPDVILKACQRLLEQAKMSGADLNNNNIKFLLEKSDPQQTDQ